jgi:hypothetical protein
MRISVTIEESHISHVLKEIITHPNKDEFVKLLSHLISDNNKAVDYFIKLNFGGTLPEPYVVGTICKVDTKHIYSCPVKNPELTCVVKEFKGYHNYSDYTIEYRDDIGNVHTASISHDCLTVIEEF